MTIQHRRLPALCLLLLTSLVSAFTACEVDTRVAVADPAIPPTFKLSGNGYLFHFIVVGPYNSLEEIESNDPRADVVWQVSPGARAADRVRDLPEITYAKVPAGFKQDIPATGPAPGLQEGKFYSIGTPSISANFRVMCFKVERSTVVAAPCRER